MAKSRLALATAILILLPVSPGAADDPMPIDYREVDPANLVLIDTRYGEVAVELAPAMAPRHVERLRALVRSHFYDGLSFYRVIEGFVAQGGAGEGTASTGGARTADTAKIWPQLKAEFDAPLGGTFVPLGSPDLFAGELGHIDGFPIARDEKDRRQWLIHCPGTFAFARDNGPDTASTEFYIVIGEAPRRLDRDLTAFGRVISGMQYLQKLERGDPDIDNGVIADVAKRDPIVRMRVAIDLPPRERPRFAVMSTGSPAFAAVKKDRLHPTSPFYFRLPPPVLDICTVPVAVRSLGHG